MDIFIDVMHFPGPEKSAAPSSRTSRFSSWASTCNFSFLLAQWTRDQECRLPTKSLKEKARSCPGQAKFESFLSQGQAEIQVFFDPCFPIFSLKHKINLTSWFIVPNLVNMLTFIRICCQLIKTWDPNLLIFTKKWMPRGQWFLCKFGVPYFSEFAMHGLLWNFTKFSIMVNWTMDQGVFLFIWKIITRNCWYCVTLVKRSIITVIISIPGERFPYYHWWWLLNFLQQSWWSLKNHSLEDTFSSPKYFH